MSIEITKLAVLSLKILSLGDRKEKSSRRGQEASISSVPGNEVLEGNRCPSPPCGITFYNTRRIKRLPWPQSGTPPPTTQPPAFSPQQRLDPTPAPPPPETRPRLLPLSSPDLPQQENSTPWAGPVRQRPSPTRPPAPHRPRRPPRTSGWRRRWRRLPRQREPYKMATAARASARPGPFSRASSRTRECALPPSPPPRGSRATNPAAAYKWLLQARLPASPARGRGQLVTPLRSGGQPAPSPG